MSKLETTLFYSKYCPHSKNFILEIQKLGLINYFHNYICVDKRNNLPEFVKRIPCIIVEGYEEPLSGEKAFSWIDFMKIKKADYEQKKSNINSFDFNNSFDNFDSINPEQKKEGSITKNDSLGLDMLEQPLLSEKDKKELTEKYENLSFDERLKELENTRG